MNLPACNKAGLTLCLFLSLDKEFRDGNSYPALRGLPIFLVLHHQTVAFIFMFMAWPTKAVPFSFLVLNFEVRSTCRERYQSRLYNLMSFDECIHPITISLIKTQNMPLPGTHPKLPPVVSYPRDKHPLFYHDALLLLQENHIGGISLLGLGLSFCCLFSASLACFFFFLFLFYFGLIKYSFF